ncbi:MAG: aminotransferase class III-fold pyridoxal phosphate-dependent enzyme [Pseudonocardiaceae bacterium]|nr:aminotransferase class III-fold pyridoxal phosphate-dependent enzyme [Pseudonocardiaceae bacterium]
MTAQVGHHGALGDLDEGSVPQLRTEVPGPRSLELADRDARHHASNSSPPAQLLRVVPEDGHGALIRDVDGNVYIDLCSGVVVTNLGHAPAPVVAALQQELGRLMHFFDFVTPARPAFFEALAATLPPSLQTFQMYTTGAEAVEAAIRLAKSYTGGYEVVCFDRAWHGRTLATMALSGASPLKQGYGPFPPGAIRSPNAYPYRCPVGSCGKITQDTCRLDCARAIDRVYAESGEGRLAAVIIEPVQGVGGVIPQPPEFLAHLREFCDRTGALLIFDEVLTGAGRTGSMWAFEQSGVLPDVLVAGKGLGSGYPLSLLASRREVLDAGHFGKPGAGASTFASGSLACTAGAATLGMLADGTILAGVRRTGELMLSALQELQARHPIIGDVRGAGLLLGVELVTDRETRERPPATVPRALMVALARRGVLTASPGPVLRLSPPLVISQRLALRAMELLDDALTEVERDFDIGTGGLR